MSTDKRNVFAIRSFINEYLDLKKDKDDEVIAVESIRKGVVFKGSNLWILIFATFMASLGLNVNSTAVIIGAMLISPLMGPIMGIGLATGISDFELMKRSFKSYLITTLFSVVTSTVFFLISPLAEAQSELLARTSPNIYDVLIALFGGLAGVVALSAKEKGNVIPGVAIATALMPPLCTAGYGLATGNLAFFLGAFYLYFINSVFIAVATFIGVRVMHFRRKEFVDKSREMKVRKYIVFVVILTMIPSIYLTTNIIKETVFNSSASKFIAEELVFNNTQIIDKSVHVVDSTKQKEIRIVLVGEEVPEASIELARQKLPKYNLAGTRLVVIQGLSDNVPDLGLLKASIMEDFYKDSQQSIRGYQEQVKDLESKLLKSEEYNQLAVKITPELKVLYPSIKMFSISQMVQVDVETAKPETVTLVVVKSIPELSSDDKVKLNKWITARVDAKVIKLIFE